MSDIVNSMKDTFAEYFSIGGKSHIIMLIIAMLFIVLLAKESKIKRATVYIPICILAFIIINPLVYMLFDFTYEYSYYRVYWLILFPVIIGAAVCIAIKEMDEHKRFVALLIAVTAIMLTGPIIGMNNKLSPVQNVYRLDNQVIEVADIIMADKCKDKKAVLPNDIAWQIRQYKDIKVLYGRDYWDVYVKGTDKSIYEMLNGEREIDINIVTEAAKNTNFPFIVLKSGMAEREAMWEHGFQNIGATEDYVIYRSVSF